MTNKSIRSVLEEVKFTSHTHPGLWLERYLPRQTNMVGARGVSDHDDREAQTNKKDLLTDIDQKASVPDGYAHFFERRWRALKTEEDASEVTRFMVFKCYGRMVVGMGQGGVLENGITLDHTWGVPIIPGSSLKGVTAAAAHRLLEDNAWNKDKDGFAAGDYARTLFGTVEGAGVVTFHDAWWIPDDQNKLPLHLDIITAHNSSYYQAGHKDKEIPAPQGRDNPIPVSFLSSSGAYLVALTCSKEAAEMGWLDAAADILRIGLERLGVGAKTNAGYGRMQDIPRDEAEQAYLKQLWLRIEPPRPKTPREEAEEAFLIMTLSDRQDWVANHMERELTQDPLSEKESLLREMLEVEHGEAWRAGRGGENRSKQKLKEYGNWLGGLNEKELPSEDSSSTPSFERESLHGLYSEDGSPDKERLRAACQEAVAQNNWMDKELDYLAEVLDDYVNKTGKKKIKKKDTKWIDAFTALKKK